MTSLRTEKKWLGCESCVLDNSGKIIDIRTLKKGKQNETYFMIKEHMIGLINDSRGVYVEVPLEI